MIPRTASRLTGLAWRVLILFEVRTGRALAGPPRSLSDSGSATNAPGSLASLKRDLRTLSNDPIW